MKSTIARDAERVSVAHDVKSYYEQLVPDDGFEVIIQNESFLSGGDTIFIEGNVLDHYKEVIPIYGSRWSGFCNTWWQGMLGSGNTEHSIS